MTRQLIALPAIWTQQSQQKIFRALLRATSYPGTVHDLSAALGGSMAALGVLATLLDNATSYCDLSNLLSESDAVLLDCPVRDPSEAAVVCADATTPPSEEFEPNRGDIYRPDRGASLVLVGRQLGAGDLQLSLAGPGISEIGSLLAEGFHPEWFRRRNQWVQEFPMGVDLFLCDASHVTALPRTTRLELTT